jgi:hypothetical protein
VKVTFLRVLENQIHIVCPTMREAIFMKKMLLQVFIIPLILEATFLARAIHIL